MLKVFLRLFSTVGYRLGTRLYLPFFGFPLGKPCRLSLLLVPSQLDLIPKGDVETLPTVEWSETIVETEICTTSLAYSMEQQEWSHCLNSVVIFCKLSFFFQQAFVSLPSSASPEPNLSPSRHGFI